jgi:aminoglycoside 6'-N-acetyltransferase
MPAALTRAPIVLAPVTDGDRFRLRRWLAEPHVIQWWGSKAAAESALALAAQSETAVARMLMLAGEPIGYAHALDLADPSLPSATWTTDVFIGSQIHRGKGHGAAGLAALRDEVFRTTLAATLAVRIAISNEHAVRAIEAVGFRWRKVATDPLLGPCWILIAERGKA